MLGWMGPLSILLAAPLLHADCLAPDVTEADIAPLMQDLGLEYDDTFARAVAMAIEDHAQAMAEACAQLQHERDAAMSMDPLQVDRQQALRAYSDAMQRWSDAKRLHNTVRRKIVLPADAFQFHDALVKAEAQATEAEALLEQARIQAVPVARAVRQHQEEAVAALAKRFATQADERNRLLFEAVAALLEDESDQAVWIQAVRQGRRRHTLPAGSTPMNRVDLSAMLSSIEVEQLDPQATAIVEGWHNDLHEALGQRNLIKAAIGNGHWRLAALGQVMEAAEAQLLRSAAEARIGSLTMQALHELSEHLPDDERARLLDSWQRTALPRIYGLTPVEVAVARHARRATTAVKASLAALLERYLQARRSLRDSIAAVQVQVNGREQAIELAARAGIASRHDLALLDEQLRLVDDAAAFDRRWLAQLADLLPEQIVKDPFSDDVDEQTPVRRSHVRGGGYVVKGVPDPDAPTAGSIDTPSLDDPTPPRKVPHPPVEDD